MHTSGCCPFDPSENVKWILWFYGYLWLMVAKCACGHYYDDDDDDDDDDSVNDDDDDDDDIVDC